MGSACYLFLISSFVSHMCFGSRPPFVFMSLCAFVLFHSLGVRKEEVRDHLCYSTVVLQALDVSTLAPSPQSVGLFVCTVYLVSVCVCVCVCGTVVIIFIPNSGASYWCYAFALRELDCTTFCGCRCLLLWLPDAAVRVRPPGRPVPPVRVLADQLDDGL